MPDVGDAGALVKRVAAGWVTQPTAASFADGISNALAQESLADEAGERGRAVAQTELSWARLTDQLEGFYQHLGRLEQCAF
jgi:glycosyltransferase involved in cell wall biosynthesis